jgi:hypothetical protein
VEVRGLVVSVTTSSLGTAFISFGREYPDQTFAGFIAAGSKMANDQRITTLPGKTIGITGKIELYQGKPEIQIKSKLFKNPMHRSGLALAGAQTTIEAWKREEVPPVENDGILTAEDVSALDLQGTWLATLSACDTGSGEARAGEGVMGLRRGFIQAGALNLLMTLWPISDEVTVQIMSDFYEAAHHSGNASEASVEVQGKWLLKLRTEKGLAQAVNLAGPLIMSSQGKP